MSKTRLITLQNKIVGTNNSSNKCMLVTTTNPTSSSRIKNIGYNLIKQSNILNGKKTIKITFIIDSNILSMSEPVLEVPYGSTLSYDGNTFIATSHNNVQYSSTANCKPTYAVESWGDFPNGEILSNVFITVTSKQSLFPITITAEHGTVTSTKLFVFKGSSYSVNGNTLTITDIDGTVNTITYTPNNTGEDTYYVYGDTVWKNINSSGTISNSLDILATQNRIEKTYTLHLSWGRNHPWLDSTDYHGWDNGDSSGNIDISVYADTTYTIHREDSAGESVSYIAKGDEKLATITYNTDNNYIGVYGFYYGSSVNDEDPSNIFLEGMQSSTKNSYSTYFKPGDYIRDNGGTQINLNAHIKQSYCWTTIYGGSWKKGGSATKNTDKTYSISLSGIVANRPIIAYLGMGSSVGQTTWNYSNGATYKPWIMYYNDKEEAKWYVENPTTNTLIVRGVMITRTTLMYWWYRWIFQRNY